MQEVPGCHRQHGEYIIHRQWQCGGIIMSSASAFLGELHGLPIAKIREYIEACEQQFEASQLYSPAAEAKYIDMEQRRSQFRAIVDPELFAMCDDLVTMLNSSQHGIAGSRRFSLVRNDVTEIRYRRGGFFRRHQDFLSVQGNVLEEHTMLVCITPAALAADIVGGSTVVHQLGGSTKSAATTTPGCALVFRKDLEHEGEVLEAGEKHVLSLNLWAVRNYASEQVLHVVFPPPETLTHAPSANDELRLAADVDSSYAIAVDDVTSEPLRNCVEWANRQAEEAGAPRAMVLPYLETTFSYAEFGTVFRILTRQHVSADDLSSHRGCLEYYFPGRLPFESILADLAPTDLLYDGSTVRIDGLATSQAELNGCRGTIQGKRAADGTFTVRIAKRSKVPEEMEGSETAQMDDQGSEEVPTEVRLEQTNLLLDAPPPSIESQISQSAKAVTEATLGAAPPFDTTVICCESEERTKVVAEVARKLGLHYVPFRCVFVEGVMGTVGELVGPPTPIHVPVTPAWISLGDYDNILLYRKFGQVNVESAAEELSLREIEELCDGFSDDYIDLDHHDEPWPHHDAAKHGPVTGVGAVEAADVLRSILEDLPPGTPLDLRDFCLECGYSHSRGVHHYGLKLAPDTERAATQSSTHMPNDTPDIHSLIYKLVLEDLREGPGVRIWLPGGDDFGGEPDDSRSRLPQSPSLLERQPRCKHGCGHPIAPGKTRRGNSFDTCCRECALRVANGGCTGLNASGGITDGASLGAADGASPGADDAGAADAGAAGGATDAGADDAGAADAGAAGGATDAGAAGGTTDATGAAPGAVCHSGWCLRRQHRESQLLCKAAATGNLFHLDSYGKACFSADEAEAASDYLASIQFDERIKACLQRKRFVLPQQERYVATGFCNETVYGKMNLLEVSLTKQHTPSRNHTSASMCACEHVGG